MTGPELNSSAGSGAETGSDAGAGVDAVAVAGPDTLFAKYGLTVDTSDWKTPPDLQLTRVTKPIRMRVLDLS
jgi:hypothetical protein